MNKMIRRVVCVAAVLVAGNCAVFAQEAQNSASSGYELINKGQEAYQAGRYKEAEALLTQAVDQKAELFYAYMLRAMVREQLQDTAGALRDASASIDMRASVPDSDPNKLQILENALQMRLALYRARNEGSKALADLDLLLSMGEKLSAETRHNAHLNRGNLLVSMERNQAAVEAYNEALRLFPNSVYALVSRSNVYEQLGRDEAAVEDLSAAIGTLEKLPSSASGDTLSMLGILYNRRSAHRYQQEQFKQALSDAEKSYAIVLKAGNKEQVWSGADLVANIRLALKDFAGAIEILGTVVGQKDRAEHERARSYSMRAYAYRSTGDTTAALNDVSEAIRLMPKDAELYSMRGNIYGNSGKFAEALQDFNMAIKLDDTKPEYYYGRAVVSLRTDNAATVCADLEKAKSMGLEAARRTYEDIVKKGLCK